MITSYANNLISSAGGYEGYCSPPGDASWQAGLTEGHWCVQLTIEDGGPNDDDGIANGTIIDPSGVSTTSSNTLPTAQSDSREVVMGSTVSIEVLVNDTDADGDALAITSASAQLGTATVVNDQIVYQAPEGFYGEDIIDYSITDGNG